MDMEIDEKADEVAVAPAPVRRNNEFIYRFIYDLPQRLVQPDMWQRRFRVVRFVPQGDAEMQAPAIAQ
jgi:hypothetical protein